MTPLELVAVRFLPTALVFAGLLLPTRGRQVWQMGRAEGWRLPLLGLTGSVLPSASLGWGQDEFAFSDTTLPAVLRRGDE